MPMKALPLFACVCAQKQISLAHYNGVSTPSSFIAILSAMKLSPRLVETDASQTISPQSLDTMPEDPVESNMLHSYMLS